MSVQTVLTTLAAHGGLAGIVASRIYRGRLPKDPTYPLILFRAAEDPESHLSGESDLKHFEFEFELYAENYAQLEQIKTQLKEALSLLDAVCTAVADDDYQDATGNYSIFLDFSIWL